MTLKRMLPLVTVLSFLAAVVCAPSRAAEDNKFDIVGLKLGMTYEQVKEALAGLDIPASDIQETRQSFGYSDGVKHNHRTDDFPYSISASKRVQGSQNNDSFKILFSPPPEGGSVVAISRYVTIETDPPTNGQYRDALYEKYGPPTVPHKNVNVDQWLFAEGSMNCLDGSLNSQISLPIKSSRGRDTTFILEKVFYTSGSSILTDKFRNGRVKDLKECANILQYVINGFSLGSDKPFKTANAILIDVQSWVRSELAANAMVENLRQEAVKKREGLGTKPLL
jgi:hypothetical protein